MSLTRWSGKMRITRLLLVALAALALLAGAAENAMAQDASSVPVAARDLPRGVVLQEADILRTERDSIGPRDPAAVQPGWITRRVIREGEILRAPAVAAPALVTAGEMVQLVWRRGDLELRLRGTALRDAALGEPVSVRVDTRRHLEGIAAGPALVRIDTQPKKGS
ncbi:MAG TPA: flagellar basal body P-ring formation chaperone FlgA [Longimicrobiaceae bacterium]|nr:flagellar basal body P-ring formation chaperone FlgA [Longimicrobiaceae bacterium]